MSGFIHATARFDAAGLDETSKVLAFVQVSPEVVVGRNCVLREHSMLIGPVVLDDDVELQPGVQLLGRVHLEHGVVVGAGAVVGALGGSVDPEDGETVIRRFASVDYNATVYPGVSIGRRAVVEPGSVVTQSVPANAVVSGNPATIVSYVDAEPTARPAERAASPVDAGEIAETRVPGVTIHGLTDARDLRGSLMAAEFAGLPFVPLRLFTVYGVPSESVRGSHAHRVCSQFLICTAGSLSTLVDDGSSREEILLSGPNIGVHIPPMIWGTQWKYTHDATLLVLASHPYDAADYIRDYEEFLEAREVGT